MQSFCLAGNGSFRSSRRYPRRVRFAAILVALRNVAECAINLAPS